MTNHFEVSEYGPGWAVADYDGNIKPGRWITADDAWEFGACGRYLLSGFEVVRMDA